MRYNDGYWCSSSFDEIVTDEGDSLVQRLEDRGLGELIAERDLLRESIVHHTDQVDLSLAEMELFLPDAKLEKLGGYEATERDRIHRMSGSRRGEWFVGTSHEHRLKTHSLLAAKKEEDSHRLRLVELLISAYRSGSDIDQLLSPHVPASVLSAAGRLKSHIDSLGLRPRELLKARLTYIEHIVLHRNNPYVAPSRMALCRQIAELEIRNEDPSLTGDARTIMVKRTAKAVDRFLDRHLRRRVVESLSTQDHYLVIARAWRRLKRRL